MIVRYSPSLDGAIQHGIIRCCCNSGGASEVLLQPVLCYQVDQQAVFCFGFTRQIDAHFAFHVNRDAIGLSRFSMPDHHLSGAQSCLALLDAAVAFQNRDTDKIFFPLLRVLCGDGNRLFFRRFIFRFFIGCFRGAEETGLSRRNRHRSAKQC